MDDALLMYRVYSTRELSLPQPLTPTLAARRISLLSLFFDVQERGGFEAVTRERKWRDVAFSLIGDVGPSNVSTRCKQLYAKRLLPIEADLKASIIRQLEAKSSTCDQQQTNEISVDEETGTEVHIKRERQDETPENQAPASTTPFVPCFQPFVDDRLQLQSV